ncbi:hypothetical protein [Luteolibacter sp. Populi]
MKRESSTLLRRALKWPVRARTLRLQPVEYRTEENPPYLPASL